MKNKLFLLTVLCLGFLLTQPGNIYAQKGKSKVAASQSATQNNSSLPFCDQVIPQKTKEYQKKANANCETVQVTTPCQQRGCNCTVYARVVLQPECDDAAELNRGDFVQLPTKQNADDTFMEILQSKCPKGGSDLSVVMIGNEIESAMDAIPENIYSYQWEVDGRTVSKNRSISCACGKEAKVTVIHLPSKKEATRVIKLKPCATSMPGSKN